MKTDYVRKHRSHLFGVMRACGLTSGDCGNILHWMEKYENDRDIHHVVAGLKRRLMALLDPSKDVFRRYGDNTWAGVFRPVTRIAKRGRKGFRNALRILKLYGVFVAPQPTIVEYNAERDRLAVPDLEVGCLEPSEIPQEFYEIPFSKNLTDCYPLHDSSLPLESGSVPLPDATFKDHVQSLDMVPALVLAHYRFFREVVGYSLPSRSYFIQLSKSRSDVLGNAVLLTKDGGLKLRLIANVLPLVQLAIGRMSETLFSTLRHIPGCYVFNQDGGVKWAASRLREGVRLSSVDLSSASDNIPLEPQLRMVRDVWGDREEFDLFERCARTTFRTPVGSTIKWNRGHPMGLKASFPLFTLFLYALVRKHTGVFAIVGDDLIMEAGVTEKVLAEFQKYGIPVNTFKSLLHSTLAEFCGRIVDRNGPLKVYKASIQKTRSDPLGLFRQYGERAFRYIYRDTKTAPVKRLRILNYISSLAGTGEWTLICPFLRDQEIERFVGLRQSADVGGIPLKLLEEFFKDIPLRRLAENVFHKDRQVTHDPDLYVPPKYGFYPKAGGFIDNPPSLTFDERARFLVEAGLQFEKPDVLPRYHIKCWTFPENNPQSVLEYSTELVSRLKRFTGNRDAISYSFPRILSAWKEVLMEKHGIKEVTSVKYRFVKGKGRVGKVLQRQEAERIEPLDYLNKIWSIYSKGVSRRANPGYTK